MADDQCYEKTCEFSLVLFWYGGVHTSYDAKAGVKRSLLLKGRIDDPHVDFSGHSWPEEPASAFHDKPVHLDISSSFDPEWWQRIRAKLGTPDACGLVRVRAGVEPKRVESEDGEHEPFEVEPVQMTLVVSADAFEAIWRQVAEADSQRRTMRAELTLVGDSLPESDCMPFIDLKDFDVAEDREYAVGSFEIHGGYVDRLRGRMRPIERGRGEAYGASIRILITQTRYDLSAAHGRPHSISCEGRVMGSKGAPYDCANVTVNFLEHWGADSYYKLPERSFFGEFSYLPEREPFPTGFNFNLWYVSEGDWKLLAPLLTRGAETRVFLVVNLTIEETELLAATDELQGNVRDYSFEVLRRLVDYSAALGELRNAIERAENALSEGGSRDTRLLNRGVEEARFQDIRHWLLAGGRGMSDRDLDRLSREQLDSLVDELRWQGG
jgi:hypothetical protein